MCGIAGGTFQDRELLVRMTDSLTHRGPDGSGYEISEGVALGHRRLAILDLSPQGHQPMRHGDLSITFNGEVYNFEALRVELKLKGYTFNSNSDTEVVLKAYEEWGPSCTSRFNGMWAFVIHDKRKKQLFFSRDRFGIKPFFFLHQTERFFFASEIKAFKQLPSVNWSVDPFGLNQFFYQKYTSAPNTLFASIKQLPPGWQGTFDLSSGKFHSYPYYDLELEIKRAEQLSEKELNANLEAALKDAVRLRMISDVPFGAFLSGGLDSSAISAWAQEELQGGGAQLNTFSLGFEESSYDESSFAQQVADHLGTQHNIDVARPDADLWEKLQKHLDEPFGDASIIPTTLLCAMTRKHVTVALSGDAGDELFGGYDTHRAWYVAQLVPSCLRKPLKSFGQLLPVDYENKVSLSFKIQRFTRDLTESPLRRHLDWMATFTDTPRKALLGPDYIPSLEIFPIEDLDPYAFRSIQLLDMKYYLPGDILRKVDRASMIHSLEARVPFLDHRVVPLALALNTKRKINLRDQKIWLKERVKPLLPKEILNRSKRGFTVPIQSWLKLRSDDERFTHWHDHYPKTSEPLLKQFRDHPDQFGRERWLIEQYIGTLEA